ncbi:MAG: right-handed parallel beta-helix repeat-containing protein [Pseudomonadota bacterium]|nr:right-handed parallel beta-helix repeat-containing protein [Pseudomonadota bacterium]
MTTFFIDPSAGLNGSGTLASPFNTWSGISMSPGNTYQQKSGTSYGSAVTVTVVASSGSPVVIGSYGTGAQPHTGGFNFIGAAFVTLSGFDVSNPGNFAANIVSGSNNITVDGCSLHDSSEGASINAGAGANNVISNNQVFNNADSGITVETTNGPNTITRNVIHDNGTHGIELSGLATSSATGCTVTFNLCQFNGNRVPGATGIHTFAVSRTTGEGGWNTIKWNVSTHTHDGASGDGNGIQVDQWTNNCLIESNLVAYNDGAGIALYGTNNNTIDLNVVHWNQQGLNSNHGTRSETYITRDLSNNNPDGSNVLINNAIRPQPGTGSVEIINDDSSNTISPNYLSGAVNAAAQTWFNNFQAQNPPAGILAVAQSVMQDMGVSTGVDPQVGQTLTATNGTWTNSPTSFTRQWKSAGTVISGATASTYVPVSGDIGNTLTVSVTATNASGSSTPATSAATAAVTAASGVPVNTGIPTISGTPQVGQTLTSTNATWTNNPTSFTYQWNRAGSAIGGAIASSYVPVSADVGSTLTVSVTATNASGSSAPATSAATAVVTTSNIVYPSQTTYSSQAPVISLSRPAYLTWTLLGNGFDTSIIRITNSDSNFGTGLPFYRHSYAKKDVWNSDGSLIMLIFDTPQPNYLLDGNTFAFIRQFSIPGGNSAWSHNDRDLIYMVNGNSFLKYKVSTGATTTLHTFSAYSSISMGQGEGNLSNNDRYAPITGSRSGFEDVMVYDLVANTVSSVHAYNTGVDAVDWFGVSQSGNYAVAKTVRGGTAFYDVYNTSMALLHTSTAYAGGHQDFGYNIAGDEVLFGPADPNSTAMWTTRLSDDVQVLQGSPSVNPYSSHQSCRNLSRPGYGYVSSFAHAAPNAGFGYHEIYSLKLDGSGTVERFSQDFKAELPISHDTYACQGHAVCNRDGSKVLFASDWGDSSASGIIHTYVATRR